MSAAHNNGNSAAFPIVGANVETSYGLTKREYFAAMAMQAHRIAEPLQDSLNLAHRSLNDADALLKALAESEVKP